MIGSRQKTFAQPHWISRRGFIEKSFIGSLTAGITQGIKPLIMSGPFFDADRDEIELKVMGNEREGYGVTLTYRDQPVARHNAGGEFSAIFQNGERSLEDRVEDWKARSWKGDARRVTLEGI